MRSLAESLSKNGRPMSHTVLSQIENQQRRIDVDELMILAGELDTSVAALFVPHTDDPSEVVGSAISDSDTAQKVVARIFQDSSGYPDWVSTAVGRSTGTMFQNVYGITELITGMKDELPNVNKEDLFKIALRTVVYLEDDLHGKH